MFARFIQKVKGLLPCPAITLLDTFAIFPPTVPARLDLARLAHLVPAKVVLF